MLCSETSRLYLVLDVLILMDRCFNSGNRTPAFTLLSQITFKTVLFLIAPGLFFFPRNEILICSLYHGVQQMETL